MKNLNPNYPFKCQMHNVLDISLLRRGRGRQIDRKKSESTAELVWLFLLSMYFLRPLKKNPVRLESVFASKCILLLDNCLLTPCCEECGNYLYFRTPTSCQGPVPLFRWLACLPYSFSGLKVSNNQNISQYWSFFLLVSCDTVCDFDL